MYIQKDIVIDQAACGPLPVDYQKYKNENKIMLPALTPHLKIKKEAIVSKMANTTGIPMAKPYSRAVLLLLRPPFAVKINIRRSVS